MKWTKEQMEELADCFAKVFVETVEHAGGTATIVDSAAARHETQPTCPQCGAIVPINWVECDQCGTRR